ncbi:MAG TPA: CRISPR-associated helicase Cas3', partial [Dysgonamonadaceae bacterium]|nr:CRISPR-associated helicase Cas3' [Dysgonamonadaceae bacterium]
MLDASQVALILWEKFFSPALQNRFTGWLGNNSEQVSRTLSFWVALHDIGKASPAFQSKNIELQTGLITLGLNFPKLCFPQHHGLVTYWALESLLPASGMSKKDSKAIARALAGHHGAWPTPLQTIDESKSENLGGDYFQTWEAARKDLFDSLFFLLNPLKTVNLPEDTEQRNAFLTLFSGFVSTADWIASMENMFPYADYRIPVSEYRLQSFSEAEQTIHQLGFDGWKADGSSLDFQNTFSFSPNKLQEKVLETTSRSDLPAMLIVEAPTGCGKTEMAFSVADAWVQHAHGSGIYIAMPTMATSNSMFDRTKNDYLLKRYPNDRINLHLVHGAALLQDNFQNMIMKSVGEDSESALAAMSWFLPHKRTLLASFAVGTVDQVFLSVLNTRHFFVRLFGLGGKVLIFDEVHAYDLYMQELFCRLLEWLRAAGVSVIILSATLPSQTRRELIKAYSGNDCSDTNSDYPGFTLVDPQGSRSFPLPPDRSRNVFIHWINPETDSIISVLKDQLSDG